MFCLYRNKVHKPTYKAKYSYLTSNSQSAQGCKTLYFAQQVAANSIPATKFSPIAHHPQDWRR